MQQIVITGAKPYDGRYDLDLDVELTTREWGWIKRHAGYLPLALTDDAFGDPELVCVLAVIAMRRAGRIQPAEVASTFDKLADAPFGTTITVTGEPDQEDREDPPQSKPNSNGATSGAASPTSSATSASTPSPTGTPASATSASAPPTSAS